MPKIRTLPPILAAIALLVSIETHAASFSVAYAFKGGTAYDATPYGR